MTKIIYKHFEVSERAKGKNKRLSIVGVFYDQARPNDIIKYTFTGIQRAIVQRGVKKQETVGLEMGRDAILDEYKKRGVNPPISRKERSRLKKILVANLR